MEQIPHTTIQIPLNLLPYLIGHWDIEASSLSRGPQALKSETAIRSAIETKFPSFFSLSMHPHLCGRAHRKKSRKSKENFPILTSSGEQEAATLFLWAHEWFSGGALGCARTTHADAE